MPGGEKFRLTFGLSQFPLLVHKGTKVALLYSREGLVVHRRYYLIANRRRVMLS